MRRTSYFALTRVTRAVGSCHTGGTILSAVRCASGRSCSSPGDKGTQDAPMAKETVCVRHARDIVRRMQNSTPGQRAYVLEKVAFLSDAIYARQTHSLVFPWYAHEGVLNAFSSVHGGALSMLADAFTTAHACAVACGSAQAVHAQSVAFEIHFLSAIFAKATCLCVTHVAENSGDPALPALKHVDFYFEDTTTKLVCARGSHVVSVTSVTSVHEDDAHREEGGGSCQ